MDISKPDPGGGGWASQARAEPRYVSRGLPWSACGSNNVWTLAKLAGGASAPFNPGTSASAKMICPTCRYNGPPGFIQNGAALEPYPDCGGAMVAHCCDGLPTNVMALGGGGRELRAFRIVHQMQEGVWSHSHLPAMRVATLPAGASISA